jgi:hypothetical protein
MKDPLEIIATEKRKYLARNSDRQSSFPLERRINRKIKTKFKTIYSEIARLEVFMSDEETASNLAYQRSAIERYKDLVGIISCYFGYNNLKDHASIVIKETEERISALTLKRKNLSPNGSYDKPAAYYRKIPRIGLI